MVNFNNIQLLDCTLRDGGHVNNFNFGKENIEKIVKGLSASGVDIIELGFLKNGVHNPNQTLFNLVSEAESYTNISGFKNQNYSLMIRPDWYDISKLTPACFNIKNLRFAFHFKDLDLTLKQVNVAKDLGYEIMLNPINILSYTQQEMENLLPILNSLNPKCISIVDTFGAILPEDLKNIFNLFNNHLDKEIMLGLHLHENLSISLALAIIFSELIGNDRNGCIDSSVLGMGRIPGNLCTELIMNFFNSKNNDRFNLKEIYNLIDDPISSIKESEPWGYMPVYALTAFNKTHRSYAEFLMKKPGVTLNQIALVLKKLASDEEKENFQETLADFYYYEVVGEAK